MKTKHLLAMGLISLLPAAANEPSRDEKPADPAPPKDKVQIAILLDTSNSMDGLIDQARTQLWKMVNTFVDARRDGNAPFVEVALYEYGNNKLHVENNYVRQISGFTRDLDQISSDLFALKTDGGEEYCGAVVRRALSDLSWDTSDKTYKTIFIAGNEPFTQGPVNVREACKDAGREHIIVNAIHCGNREQGIAGSWHDGPALAEGKFLIIDQDKAVAHVDAPQDKRIAELSDSLNKTYLGYGKDRAVAAEKQTKADKDAAANAGKGAQVGRAVTKASANYCNTSWDLVDAVREKTIDLAKLKEEDLPEELKNLSPEARVEKVKKAQEERASIQAEILKLNKEREAHVAAELKKQADGGEQTLDQALAETTRKQASGFGYEFKK